MGIKRNAAWIGGAALWGFAEATAFFVVPDVLLSAVVLRKGFRVGAAASVAAALAALAGGIAMMGWARGDPTAARAFVDAVPLVGADLIIRVQNEITGDWAQNLAIGAISGAPYKIYATEAGAAGLNAAAFAAVSFAARLARFMLATSLVAGWRSLLRRAGRPALAVPTVVAAWGLIYLVYIVIRLQA